MKLIVGLGNPGSKYAKTRHNVGFWVIEALADKLNIEVKKVFLRAHTGDAHFAGEKIILAKPQTYMNLSGESIAALLNWYKLSPGDLIVIYDDMDLPPGTIRLRPKGGSGGHRGIQSVIDNIGVKEFPRLRIGIGKPEHEMHETTDWVLGKFTPGEKEAVLDAIERAANAIEMTIEKGIDEAMNWYNK